MSLKKKFVSGVFWNFIEQAFLFVFRFLINVLIARQLFPEDYGLIAMVVVFIQIAEVLVNGGLKNALIRKEKLLPEDISTVFFFNLGIAFATYLLFYFTAPIIAGFYDIPSFILVSRVLGLVIIIHALSLVQDAIVNRNVNFKLLAKINIGATFLGGILGVALAYKGFGVWSLVAQMIFKAVASSLFFWLNNSQKIKLVFSKISFRENFRFGYKLVLSGLINSIFNNLYQLVIGKVYSAASLGNYTQGKRLGEMPSMIFYQLFQKTSFPLLSSIQNENERFNRVYLKIIRILSFISFPVAFLMLLIGEPLILLLLTDKWASSIPFFYILCFSGMFFPITGISAYACLAKGRSDLFLKLEILYKGLMLILIAITYRFDIIIMVGGQGLLLFVQFLVNFIITGKVIGLNLKSQLLATAPAFTLSLIVLSVTYFLTSFELEATWKILLQVSIFTIFYLGSSYILKIPELSSIQNLISEKIFTKNNEKES